MAKAAKNTHQQSGLKFKEETNETIELEHGFIQC